MKQESQSCYMWGRKQQSVLAHKRQSGMRRTFASLQSLQAGEVEAVLKLGERVLDTSESQALRRDILLSMALAHCNLATRALERDTSVGRKSQLASHSAALAVGTVRLEASTSWEQRILPGCSAACLSVTTHLTK